VRRRSFCLRSGRGHFGEGLEQVKSSFNIRSSPRRRHFGVIKLSPFLFSSSFTFTFRVELICL
jgi:hypothetical protein